MKRKFSVYNRKKRLFILFLFINVIVSQNSAFSMDFFDNFQNDTIKMPDGTFKLYPSPKSWGYTFAPGLKWPDSFGNGTNYLEANGECQIYLNPFIDKVNGRNIPSAMRYDPFDVSEEGLRITARPLSQEQRSIYKANSARYFGSGMLLTKFSFKYANIKVIAKLPAAEGSWPAIWMLAKNDAWPPELDIVEGMSWGKHINEFHSGFIGKEDEKNLSFGDWYKTSSDISSSFHTYELDWTEDNLSMKFDNQIIWAKPTPKSMQQEMYLIINLAVGGKWPYNELGILPTDAIDELRLSKGSAKISSKYPATLVIKSVEIKSK